MNKFPSNAHHLKRLVQSHAQATEQVYEDVLRATAQTVLSQLLVASGTASTNQIFVKGGVSLLIRFGLETARYTRDFDASLKFDDKSDLELERLLSEAKWNGFYLSDVRSLASHFPEDVPSQNAVIGFRARLMLGPSEVISVKVEFSRDELDAGEWVLESFPETFTTLLDSLNLPTLEPIRAIPIHIHLAQKIHAVTDPREFRPRDLYDIALIQEGGDIPLDKVLVTAKEIFKLRGRQSWPPNLDSRYLDEAEYRIAVGPRVGRISHTDAIVVFNKMLNELVALDQE